MIILFSLYTLICFTICSIVKNQKYVFVHFSTAISISEFTVLTYNILIFSFIIGNGT